jgi:hypothetical protein
MDGLSASGEARVAVVLLAVRADDRYVGREVQVVVEPACVGDVPTWLLAPASR